MGINNNNKAKWEAIIVTFTLILCAIGLAGLSYISFFQTLFAFLPLNDPSMIVGGVAVGNWVAFLCACIFQYGQNAALYIRKIYGTDKVLFNVMGFFDIRNKDIYLIVFGICALIDGGTNMIWLASQPEVALQPLYFKVVEYSVMGLLVFVEEVLGITLEALSHSMKTLKGINASLRKESANQTGNNPYRPMQQQPNNPYNPVAQSKSYQTPKPAQQKPVSSTFSEPTYHPVGMSTVSNNQKAGSNNYFKQMEEQRKEKARLEAMNATIENTNEEGEEPSWLR